MSTTKGRAVVIGAGIIGSSIGLELARSGWHTTVVDKYGEPGQGSTSATSAIVRYHYDHLPEAALAWEAGHRWMKWEDTLGVTDPRGLANFIRAGALVLDGVLKDRKASILNMTTLGIDVAELTAEELHARFPALDIAALGPPARTEDERFWRAATSELGGFWVPDAGYVDDPQLAVLNLAHAAMANGCEFLFKSVMTELRLSEGKVIGVELADGRSIDADVVVNAAGPWSAEVNRKANALSDFSVSTRPLEQEVISLPVPEGFSLEQGGTCVTDADLGTYFRPHGNTLLVGGMEADCDPLVYLGAPEEVRASVSHGTWEVQGLRVARRVPAATIPGQPRGVVGVYDVTDDWIPIYDRTSIPGYYVAIGTSGHGFKQAPVVGEIVKELIEASESGHDHDRDPIALRGRLTGSEIQIGHFSRRRAVRRQSRMG